MSASRRRSAILIQTAGLAAATLAVSLVALSGDTASARSSRGAAGQFDGNWNVVFAPRAGNCSQTYSAPFAVVGSRVVANGGGNVSGGISGNGSVAVQIAVGDSVASGRGRLAGNSGAGNWSGTIQGDRCSGVWQATRS
jgi:hypothetical protein